MGVSVPSVDDSADSAVGSLCGSHGATSLSTDLSNYSERSILSVKYNVACDNMTIL